MAKNYNSGAKNGKGKPSNRSQNWKGSNKSGNPKNAFQQMKEEVSADNGKSQSPATEIRQDPLWHAKSPELKRLVAALPFAQPVGIAFQRNMNSAITFENSAAVKNNVPGVLTLLVRPSFGLTSTGSVAPINVAAWAQYSAMRRILAGTFRFDPNDVLLYDVSVASVMSAIVELQRAYGLANKIEQENRYLSKSLITALGFDADDLLDNLADFEYGINILINKANSFFVPKFVELFAYHSWIYKDVYSEGEGIKDQLYAFVPDGFFQFGFDTDGAGMCKFIQLPNQQRTVKEALQYVNTMIEQIYLDEDAGEISSLLKKAYGTENSIGLLEVTPAYRTEIVPHNDYILHMFKNATVYPASFNWAPGSGNLVQDSKKELLQYSSSITPGTVAPSYTGEVVVPEAAFYASDVVLVEESPLPNEDMVIESTRQVSMLTNLVFSETGSGDPTFTADMITGSTVVTGGYIWWMDGVQTLHQTVIQTHICIDSQDIQSNNIDYSQRVINDVPLMMGLSKAFKYCPIINIWLGGLTNVEGKQFSIKSYVNLCDYDNYTTLDENEISNLHEISIMSELAVLGSVTIS